MKVLLSDDDYLEFDNGLIVTGHGDVDCCAVNYIDFTQFQVGDKFKDMNDEEFAAEASMKDDGFSLKTVEGVPKWAQARSEQNGYYSAMTTLKVEYDGSSTVLARLVGNETY